ncbi:MAG TPA: HAMP domain-containing protein, partial [Kofleriaceae bacterium]|nr:HAMP domain-containing protein [Kofleriaceae bacterium]
GIWKDLTDNVNLMGSNLTNQVRDIAMVSTAIASGDLSRKIAVEVRGEMLDLKNTINTMVDQLSSFADQVTGVARDVGLEGKLGGQATVPGASGIWKDLTDNVNLMAWNLTNQVRDIAGVTTAVANGDLSRKITVEVKGELLELKSTINTMVDQLGSFADEVTRVAREVGTEGILAGQAEVRGVSGTWRELTDNVNVMAENLTEQVRGIARVVTAVANGDLKQKLTLEAKGEIATLVDTINNMTVTLSTFADQVTGVARDVGVEGKLGGQADVPGAAGIWRDLTNNVNELAGNLTRQVRAIGDVATAVTKGDLTQSIIVEARGEVALLKDNLNQMIGTLAETTRVNQDQDWLKTNLTRFTRMLQGQRDLITVARHVLSELAPVVDVQHGVFYLAEKDADNTMLTLLASYAYRERKHLAGRFALGEGLVGQAAVEKKRILIRQAPPDYVTISSGLGEAPPQNIVVVPILFEGEVKGVIELASFAPFTEIQLAFLEQLIESLGIVVATIEATMRTDDLLRQSQGLAHELQIQQEELQQTNEELEEKARQLTEQKAEVERKNHEVELARQELEDKAEQLGLTSRYKSEFLANMSHELRTPLNSLLILSRQLADNGDGNLSEKQVEYASTVYQSGYDLLTLINEILDLAKIESGTMAIEIAEIRLAVLKDYLDRSFSQFAEEKALEFSVEISPDLPERILTDDMRLRQILRNLLSNAFKFTEQGSVKVHIFASESPSVRLGTNLEPAASVIAFAVEDTGIGIAPNKQRVIFEAFQQADGGTSRRHGGTGLGLSISREIANLLGGDIHVTSTPSVGSTFTLYLPRERTFRSLPDRLPQLTAGDAATDDGSDPAPAAPSPSRVIRDDRAAIQPGDRVLLIIENGDTTARNLLAAARSHGFRGVVALDGGRGIDLARNLAPSAIALGLTPPDMNGWALFDRLKRDPVTRHIPITLIADAQDEHRARRYGALGIVPAPVGPVAAEVALAEVVHFVDREVKELLVVGERTDLAPVFPENSVRVTATRSVKEAIARLSGPRLDCLVLGSNLAADDRFTILDAAADIAAAKNLPMVVSLPDAPTDMDRRRLQSLAERLIMIEVPDLEALIEQTALSLHHRDGDGGQHLFRPLCPDPILSGKTVLVVDDDMRNIYAITALLESHSVTVLNAENGQEALDRLAAAPDVDLVLMDLMMPEMDGYEATRRIRSRPQSAAMPVVALTAKAMKGDRDKCLATGASDYVT